MPLVRPFPSEDDHKFPCRDKSEFGQCAIMLSLSHWGTGGSFWRRSLFLVKGHCRSKATIQYMVMECFWKVYTTTCVTLYTHQRPKRSTRDLFGNDNSFYGNSLPLSEWGVSKLISQVHLTWSKSKMRLEEVAEGAEYIFPSHLCLFDCEEFYLQANTIPKHLTVCKKQKLCLHCVPKI